mgnify:FL=1
MKILIRTILSMAFSIFLADAGVRGNAEVLKTLFTVLGISFSISMSLLLSFDLSKILNSPVRKSIRREITHTRTMLLIDFVLSTLFLVVALLWNPDCIRYEICSWLVIDIELITLLCIGFSLFYEIYNFSCIHKLHGDIEDAVIAEESGKKIKQT